MSHYKNWDLHKDSKNRLWLGIDRPDSSANSISSQVLDELNSILQEVSQITDAKGLIIYSKKKNGFIAGADVIEFSNYDTPQEAGELLRKGQAVFSKLEDLNIPTVAMIHGFCMGGGLELALACDYRIACDDDSTKLGLPEILLGFHPGWGGTVRLPKLIGGLDAFSKVILTGSAIRAKKAKQLGFVDDVVPLRQLKRAACYFIDNVPAKHKPAFMQSITNTSWIRPLVARLLRQGVQKKVRKDHYPAPFAVIDLWEKEGNFNKRSYLKEADSVEKLVGKNETAKNLIRLFILRERLKSFAKGNDYDFKHVHVIGAGVMGGDIAAWCALQGLTVTLQDQSYEKIGPAIGRAHSLYKKKLKKPRYVQAALDRLIPDVSGTGIENADVIIEAVFENLEVKQKIMQDVENAAKKDAIIATNTSSIPLDDISKIMINPERLVGIHFFNPVAKMDLVEIVSSSKTSNEVEQKACAFTGRISRLPVPVKSSPGFLVNRVLMPYLMECMSLLDEGYQPEVIDSAAKDFGMFMGPVELADTVGLDVCLAVAQNLSQYFSVKIPERLKNMVKENKLGRKTGTGFYVYKNGKAQKQKVSSNADKKAIAHRLISRIVQEAQACLDEGVVADADLLDAAMVFGTGFAPFRGGPMTYAKSIDKNTLDKDKSTKSQAINQEQNANQDNQDSKDDELDISVKSHEKKAANEKLDAHV